MHIIMYLIYTHRIRYTERGRSHAGSHAYDHRIVMRPGTGVRGLVQCHGTMYMYTNQWTLAAALALRLALGRAAVTTADCSSNHFVPSGTGAQDKCTEAAGNAGLSLGGGTGAGCALGSRLLSRM